MVVRRLMLWHSQGVNIDQAMLALSTCVGRVNVTNTYWYLSAGPGARVSEIIGVRVLDAVLEGAACVHLQGKGRKERAVLWKSTVQKIRAWLPIQPTPSRRCSLTAQSRWPGDDALHRLPAI